MSSLKSFAIIKIVIYIFLALIFYTGAILVGAAASRHANTNLVAAISNLVSAVIPIAIIIPILSKKTFSSQKFGVVMAVVTGLLIALFTLALTKSYSINKIGIVAPIVFGGAIFLSTILSYFIFKERLTLTEGIGLSLLGAGLVIIIYARAAV